MPALSVDLTNTDDTLVAPALTGGPGAPGGPVWVDVRPGLRRIHTLAGDILAALGKHRDLSGRGRNQAEDLTLAIAWLRADTVGDLVVTNAQRLHPIILTSLATLAERAGTTLWLLHAAPRSDRFVAALARHCTSTAALPDVPPPVPAAPPVTHAGPGLAAVQHVEFTLFRATYRRGLPPAQAARVEHRFQAGLTRCHQQLTRAGASVDTIADLVHAILNPAPADPELVTDLRALQVACWQHDLYVKIDLAVLLRSEERPRLQPADTGTAMLAYRQPYRAITVALTQAGHSLSDLTGIRLTDACADGTVITCAGQPTRLPAETARAVRAQLHLRVSAGARPDDRLLPHTTKALAKALTDAATDLGVRVHGRRAERTRPHTTAALARLGITVTDLT